MSGSPIAFLFPTAPAVFPSDYPLAESVDRLRTVTQPLALSAWTDDTVTGVVTVENVRLERVMGSRSVYRTSFAGAFRGEGQAVVLTGVFTMHGWNWSWDKSGFGFTVFFLVMLLPPVLSHPADLWRFLLIVVVMVALDVGSMKLKQWFSRGDIQWLSRVITQALTKSGKISASPLRKPNRVTRWLYDLNGP